MASDAQVMRHFVAPARDAFRPTPPVEYQWLPALRWITCGVQWTVVAGALLFPSVDLPLRHAVPALLAAAISHTVVNVLRATGRPVPDIVSGATLIIDILLLAELLEITGGPFNPFIVIYGVLVALGAVTLSARWGIVLALVAAASCAWLVYEHLQPAGPLGHHRLNDLPTHLVTMWISGAATVELVAFFTWRAACAVAARQRELDEARARAARSEHLAGLTTLAAGAAHELSTPLATIAVAAGELDRSFRRVTDPALAAALCDDAGLIRTEVERCRAILDQMSGRASADVVTEPMDLERVAWHVRQRLEPDRQARLDVELTADEEGPAPFASGLVRAVTCLVKNAFDASAAHARVRLRINRDGRMIRVQVHDSGRGLSAEAARRAGEPFFTTKEPGSGLGLGVFLARTFAEQHGGSLTLDSGPGTVATLQLPASGRDAGAA